MSSKVLSCASHALIATCMQGSPEDVEGAMASIFVWLRYSSARHLTWQRNYNTQPRILGEAQAKLTHKIAEVSPFANCCFSRFQPTLKCLHVFQLPPASNVAGLHAACMAQTCVYFNNSAINLSFICFTEQICTLESSRSVLLLLADRGTRSSSI